MILLKFWPRSKTGKNLAFFLFGCSVGLVILLIAIACLIAGLSNEYQNRVYPGVYLFSVSISGKTTGELADFLKGKNLEIGEQKVAFFWPNKEEKKWEITPADIDFTLNTEGMINEVMTEGRSGSTLSNWLSVGRLLIFPKNIKPSIKYNQEKVDLLARRIAADIDRPVQDALFEFRNGKVVNFQVSKEGFSLDQEQFRKVVILAFSREKRSKNMLAVDLPVNKTDPKITTENTNQLGIREKIAEGESYFKDSIPSRVHNIILASSYFHGVVVPPGESFSFAKKIGTISAEVGYQQAYVIKEKKTILEDGGGVCQVSTTMFRAALNAGLPIIERQAHYYRVGFYEQGGYPPGLDATVYPPSPDFKFKNDTPAYLLIQTRIDKENKRLAFEFYGTNDGRKVELEKPIVHSQTPPPEPLYIDEPTLPVGVTKRIDAAHWGAKVSFRRVVHNKDGNLEEEKTWWSNYVPWPAVYQRGTKT